MREPKTSLATLGHLLALVERITDRDTSFELFVPTQLTDEGKHIAQGAAMAIVLDKLLERDFFPAGFVEQSGGRLYRYKKE